MKKASYPHTKPLPGEQPWVNVTLYAIAGWMSSWYLSEGLTSIDDHATAFGGYFKVSDDGQLKGELVDTFGIAVIEGELTAETLVFRKTYVYRAHSSVAKGPITYHFEKDQEVWKGGFSLSSGTCGKAECAINPAIYDAFGIVMGPLRA